MKQLFCLLILVSSFQWCFSQTQHLHSSRIGLENDTEVLNDRFGMVYEYYVTMERVVNLGDTAAFIHFGKGGQTYEYYHIANHPIFNDRSLSLKELKNRFPEVRDWVGFENRVDQKENRNEFLHFSFPETTLPPFHILLSAMILGFMYYYPTPGKEVLA